jgi:hypothetical protein
MNRLNVIGTFSEAFRAMVSYRLQIIRCLFVPAVLVVGIDLLTYYISGYLSAHILEAIRLFLYSIMALMTHRIILGNHLNLSTFRFAKIRKIEIVFFLYMFFIYLFTMFVILLIATFIIPTISTTQLIINKYTGFIVSVFIIFFPLVLMSKLGLIFPAISIGSRHDLSYILHISKDNSLKLFVVVGLLPLIFSYSLSNLNNLGGSIYYELYVSIFSIIALVIEASLLSISFKNLAA